jgi:hypothetical protein
MLDLLDISPDNGEDAFDLTFDSAKKPSQVLINTFPETLEFLNCC